jgi:hypothetical protein
MEEISQKHHTASIAKRMIPATLDRGSFNKNF